MSVRVAVNGLGRIGRCVMRAWAEENFKDIEIVAVNGPADTATHAHLLKYDSVHGTYRGELSHEGDTLIMNGSKIPVLHERDIAKLDWGKLGADVVLECTGVFTKATECQKHLDQGAKKVLLSAPAKDECPTFVYGVNHADLKDFHDVISIGSCTTNCLAPVAKVLNDEFGIEQGYMTTVHAYTGDQRILDGSHSDLRRARAAAMSMVPTKTGAAKAIGLVLPELEGKLKGTAIRVPTPNVSLVDLTVTTRDPVAAEVINAAFVEAAAGSMKGVLATSDEPLVSIDFTHHPASAIADLTGTQVVGEHFVRVAAWYDNEWGFSCRMLDLSREIAKHL